MLEKLIYRGGFHYNEEVSLTLYYKSFHYLKIRKLCIIIYKIIVYLLLLVTLYIQSIIKTKVLLSFFSKIPSKYIYVFPGFKDSNVIYVPLNVAEQYIDLLTLKINFSIEPRDKVLFLFVKEGEIFAFSYE